MPLQALAMAPALRAPRPAWSTTRTAAATYASFDYQKLLEQHGIRCSMSRRGNCLDNAPVETFFGTLNNEHVHHCDFESIEAARAGVIDYIENPYNPRRRRQST